MIIIWWCRVGRRGGKWYYSDCKFPIGMREFVQLKLLMELYRWSRYFVDFEVHIEHDPIEKLEKIYRMLPTMFRIGNVSDPVFKHVSFEGTIKVVNWTHRSLLIGISTKIRIRRKIPHLSEEHLLDDLKKFMTPWYSWGWSGKTIHHSWTTPVTQLQFKSYNQF